MKKKYNVIVQKEEKWYVAKCIENSVASQGKTVAEALANLKEALELYNEKETEESKVVLITTMEVVVN
ncbi:MAG: type II toxin-antitoxin system HicB family antitoxin [Clostridia bacterium]